MVLDPASPDRLESLFGQALARQEAGDLARAAQLYAEVLERQPRHVHAVNNLGNVMLSMGHPAEAEACFAQALAIEPGMVEAHYNRARLFQISDRPQDALAAYSAVLGQAPHLAPAAYNRAIVLREMGRIDAAIDAYQDLLAWAPEHAHAWNNLGKALRERGESAAAMAAFDRAAGLVPNDAEVASNRLFCLLHDDASGHDRLRVAQQAYAERFERGFRRSWPRHTNDRDPDRPLRVGFVSADFRDHPVGRFVAPLLGNLDHRQIVPIAFATTPVEDHQTARLKSGFVEWHAVGGLDDEAACTLVNARQIDVLVDLAGHTAGNRLGIFARRPAPVEVTWLGYLGSTGLSAMDWRITDRNCDPAGQEAWHSERLMRLPECQWCYRPVASLPLSPRGAQPGLRFGSFTGAAKLSDTVLSLWARILSGLPGASLVLAGIPDGRSRQRILEFLAGMERNSISFLDRLPISDYLAQLGSVDMALDSYPYVGGTTTCDALWMGVPVVTLAGERSCSRSGASLLSAVGLPDWVAWSPDHYVAIARSWAHKPIQLRELRAGLRSRMEHSSLMNEAGFARDWQAAVRAVWQDWCKGVQE